jgi:hypothetical protein
VAEAFAIEGRWLSSSPFGGGHINETLLAEFEAHGRRTRYVQQRINRSVFREPAQVMTNIARVVAHQRRALEREGVRDLERRVLELVPARDGALAWLDERGETWRCWRLIEGAESRDVVRGPGDARAAAHAFGRFLAQLGDLPAPRLFETIPRFHDARLRFEQLEAAVRADARGRLADCRAEVDLALAREPLVARIESLIRSGALRERVTHNDTKLNLVLLDARSGDGLCVIDLDTVMPGSALHDFGDLVRSMTSSAGEDRTAERVQVDETLLLALTRGWLSEFGELLVPAERAHLVFAGLLISFEQGVRFLTDHLDGDRYFRIPAPGHNLRRARNQFALARSLAARRSELERLVARL